MTTAHLWFRDAAERVIRTFLGTFVTLFVAEDFIGINGVDINVAKKAAVAGLTAAVSALMAVVAKWVNEPDSASVLSPPPSPPAPAEPGN